MKYIHSLDMTHRDLKPENILLDSQKQVKLADFGLCRIINNNETLSNSLTNFVGTLPFMAPELFNEKSDHTSKVDVYAFGVVVYMILSKGNYPDIQTKDKILGKKAKIDDDFSEKAIELINMCWEFDPNKRPTFTVLKKFVEKNKDDIYTI